MYRYPKAHDHLVRTALLLVFCYDLGLALPGPAFEADETSQSLSGMHQAGQAFKIRVKPPHFAKSIKVRIKPIKEKLGHLRHRPPWLQPGPGPTLPPPTGFNPSLPPGTAQSARYQMYDGPNIPSTPDNLLPFPILDTSTHEGGPFNESINTTRGITGNCIEMDYLSSNPGAIGFFYPQWNPYNYNGDPNYPGPRGWAWDYANDVASWSFNTYDRMSFWILRPTSLPPIDYQTTGPFAGDSSNMQVGTYVKSVSSPDYYSDETGGGHFYHGIAVPNNGAWTHVILNMHPDHQRSINADPGVLLHPTGESQYNYFDCLTRFYVEDMGAPSSYPAQYFMDDIMFYKSPYPEDDANIYGVTSTYNPSNNDLILTWSHARNDGISNHQVKYAFQPIHQIGWNAATPAPNGLIAPPNFNGYDGMLYETSALPLSGHPVVYVGIQAQNPTSVASNLFTEVMVPLMGLR